MNLEQAKAALANLGSQPSIEQIRSLLAQVDLVIADGKTAIFYSGPLESFDFRGPGDLQITNYRAGQIANALARDNPAYTVIDDTDVGKLLGSPELRAAVQNAVGIAATENALFHPLNGLWADASARLSGTAEGAVISISANADSARTFGSIELIGLVNNDRITTIDGIPRAQLKAYYQSSLILNGGDQAKAIAALTDVVAGRSAGNAMAGLSLGKVNGTLLVAATDEFTQLSGLSADRVVRTPAGTTLSTFSDVLASVRPGEAAAITDRMGLAARYLDNLRRVGQFTGVVGSALEIELTRRAINERLAVGDTRGAAREAAGFAGSLAGGAAGVSLAATYGSGINAIPGYGTIAYFGLVLVGGGLGAYGGEETVQSFFDAVVPPTLVSSNYETIELAAKDRLWEIKNATTELGPLGQFRLDERQVLLNGGQVPVFFGVVEGAGPLTAWVGFSNGRFTSEVLSSLSADANGRTLVQQVSRSGADGWGTSFYRLLDSNGNVLKEVGHQRYRVDVDPGGVTRTHEHVATDGTTVSVSATERAARQVVVPQGAFGDGHEPELVPVGSASIGIERTGEPGSTSGFVEANSVRSVVLQNTRFDEDRIGEFANEVNATIRTINNAAQIGSIFGSTIGRYLGGRDQLTGAALSGTLGALTKSIVQGIGAGTIARSASQSLKTAVAELPTNLQGAGIAAISSLMVAEFVQLLGADGVEGDVLNTAAGATVNTIIGNLGRLGEPILNSSGQVVGQVGPFTDLGPQLLNAAGAFVGTKLASMLVSFDTVGGQLGAAIGSAVGSFIAGAAITAGATGLAGTFASLGVIGGPLGVAAAAFVGFILGGVIGSVFGGTPRSGADVVWDEATGQFSIDNVYARQGGSKKAARQIATAVADVYNNVLEAVGGDLLNASAIQAGNYGMRATDWVYRPVSTRDKDAITARFSGKTAMADLYKYGALQGLADDDFQIAGGDVYMKRALAVTIDQAVAKGELDVEALFANFQVAADWSRYRSDPLVVDQLIRASNTSGSDEGNLLAIGWALTAARSVELGLDRRAASDWHGGWSYFLEKQVGVSAVALAPTSFANDGGPFERVFVYRRSGASDVGIIRDTIDADTQTEFAGSAGADTIDLRGAVIDVAGVVRAGAGDDRVDASDRGDNLFGEAGNDTIFGGRLDDWLFGGAGNDRLDAGAADASALGGSGNYLDGGDGDDTLLGREGSDWVVGGQGTDTLAGGAGGDILDGGKGEGDHGEGGAGTDQYIFRAGDGLDAIFDTADASRPGDPGSGISAQVRGINAGARARNWAGDGLFTADGSVIGGEDAIVFGAGITMSGIQLLRPNTPQGAPGNDLVIQLLDPATGAWNGQDQLTIQDWFVDTRRVEWLRFANGEEIRIGDLTSFKIGTAGDDVIVGSNAADFLYGGDGDDTIYGLAGDDFGVGGKGDDLVSGDRDDDWVLGSEGNDTVIGGHGDDTVFGDDGDDQVLGGIGHDLVVGGRGDDEVIGGAGDDIFRFERGDGRDTLIDDLAGSYEAVWRNGFYVNGYALDPATGEIAKDGVVYFDGSRWLGCYDYDEYFDTSLNQFVRTLSRLVPPAGDQTANAGNDTIEFGAGIDIDDIQLRRNGADLDVAVTRGGSAESFDAVADRLTLKEWYTAGAAIESFQFVETGTHNVAAMALAGGSDGADTLTGSTTQANWITGNAGDDTVTGGAGDDILAGNSGNDELRGGTGSDVLFGGSGEDRLDGGGNPFVFDPDAGPVEASLGRDTLIGGSGMDTAVYGGGSVIAHLTNTRVNAGDARGDSYVAVEGLEGGAGHDRLGGDEGENTLGGGAGDDVLMGGVGDDSYLVEADGGADAIREGVLSVEEVLDETGAFNGALYETTWVYRGYNKVAGREYRDCYQLTIRRRGTGELMYESRPDVDFTYKKNFLKGSLPGEVPLPPSSLWPTNGGQWQLGLATGNGGQYIWDRVDANVGEAAGHDEIEFGRNISLSDLTFARAGAGNEHVVIQVGASAANRVTLENQASGGRIETIKFDDGFSASLASLAIGQAGGDGDDLVVGTAGGDSLAGGAGLDVLSGGAGDDVLDGGSGDDTLEGGAGADVLAGGTDSVSAGLAPNGGAAYGDTIRYVRSGAGVSIDLATNAAGGGDATGDVLSGIENVTGSEGFGDTLVGNNLANRLIGLGGDDTLVGAGGDDVLVGGAGRDSISGGDGADNIEAGEGDDVDVHGGAGNDLVSGNAGADVLHGDAGDDMLDGGEGADTLWGGDGNDTLSAGKGDLAGNLLHGEAGNDVLTGDAGNDQLYGGADSDTLAGGEGDDHLDGGAGDDIYVFDANSGTDVVVDTTGKNRIAFTGVSHDRVWMTRSGNDLVIGVIGGGTRITVQGAFADPAGPSIREIVVGDRSLFVKYGELEGLFADMAAASAGVPASMPASVAARLDAFWWVGNKATPRIEPVAVVGSKEDLAVTGRIIAVDHDESTRTFSLIAGSGPSADQGAVTINTDGSWSFVPVANWWGAVSFRVRVVDADGLAAERTVSFDMAPVNDAPSAIDVTGKADGFAERDRPRRDSDMGRIELATLAAIDVDTLSPVHLPHTYNRLYVVGDDRFEVFEGKLYLKAGVAFDFEAQGSVSVTVRAEDESDPSLFVDRVLTFDILDIVDLLEATAPGQALVGQEPRAGLGGNDELIGYDGNNDIQGLGGNDLLRGGVGDDRLDGGAGNDELHGELGLDLLIGGAGDDRLFGGEDDDVLDGGEGADALYGGAGKDRLVGGAGDDAIFGDADDDTIIADAGADAIHGGDGVDTIDYSASGSAVAVTLGGGAGAGDLAEGDTLTAVENVVGSAFNDSIAGDAADNRLAGGAGDDRLSGLGGDDTLEGGSGRDLLLGGDGADVIRGGDGDDWDGVSLDSATATAGLFGGAGKDLLEGGAGDDALFGGDGNDILDGGSGNDRLDGGTGHDLYEVYRTSGHDRIHNWDPTGDDIDVVGYREGITRDHLWFTRDGDDLIVEVIGEDVSTRVVDWYVATTATQRGNHRIDFFSATGANGQPGWTTVEMNAQAMVDLMAGFTKPASVAEFAAMSAPGTAFGDAWNAAWQRNAPPAIFGVSDQVMNEDGTLTVTLTLTDDVTPADLVRFDVTAVNPDDYAQPDISIVDTLSWTRGAGDGEVIVTFKPKADASGRLALKVVATDANDDKATAFFAVAVRGVADAPELRVDADTSGVFRNGTRLGSLDSAGIPLIIQPTLTDTDGSEEIAAVYIEGLPQGLTLSAGSRQADGRWLVLPTELAGLKINPKPTPDGTPGWSQDLTGTHALKITTVSRETGTNPAPAVPTAVSQVQTLELIINTRPHALSASGAMAVAENVDDRTLVLGTFAGQDADGDALTYALVPGFDAGGRLVVRSDGRLQLTGAGAFDHESEPTKTIRVRVTDTAGATYEKDFTLTINNVNEAPTGIALASATTQVTEKVTSAQTSNVNRVVATFSTVDPDAAGAGIRLLAGSSPYLRVSGNQLLLPATELDFDSLAAAGVELADIDGDGQREAVLRGTVAAFDGEFTSAASVATAFYVEDQNEAPTLLTPTGALTVSFRAPGGNLVTVGSVGALDADNQSYNRDHRFAIVGGNDGAMFSIDPTSGTIRLSGSLVNDPRPSWNLSVRVTDQAGGGLSDTRSVAINVVDINRAPAPYVQGPIWSVDSSYYLGAQVVGNDPDNDPVTYQVIAAYDESTASGVNQAGRVGLSSNGTVTLPFTQTGTNNYRLRWNLTVRATDIYGAFNDANFWMVQNPIGFDPPVVLDLDGDGVELVSLAASTVDFDMDGDGLVDRTGWAAADDGFLALDRDGNGTIDNSSEISFAADLTGAESDLEGLRAYDSDGDGSFDTDDTDFARFRVWQDANQDGVSQAGELTTLAERGITGIDLGLTKTGERVSEASDNVIYATSTYQKADGSAGALADVFLAYRPADESTLIDHAGANAEVLAAEAANPGDEPPAEVPVPVIQGLDGDDELLGTDGDDLFEGAGGNDTLRGGAGFDTAFYIGNLSDYRIETRDGGVFVVGQSGDGLLDGTDGLFSIEKLSFFDASVGLAAPIVLDLNGNGVKLKSMSKSFAHFDMNGDGAAERTAWISRGDGFLVLDRNNNGTVDDGSEISFVGDKPGAKSDLDGLTAFDSNGDRELSAADARFTEFRIWHDANGNGRSDADELLSLQQAGIAAINLVGDPTSRRWKLGTAPIVNGITFTRTDGSTGEGADAMLSFSTMKKTAQEVWNERRALNFDGEARSQRDQALRSLTEVIADDQSGGRGDGLIPANDSGSSELNRLIEQMAAFGGANDETASADSINWRKGTDALHFGLIAASGINA